MASQLFYQMVTAHTVAETDQDHINLILLSDTSMPDRTDAILAGNWEDVREQMLEDALFLQNSGCTAIAVTCNTAHFFVDMIQNELRIPVLHMIKETAKAVAKDFPGGTIGIMATDGTIKTGLYQKALAENGMTPWTPPADIQQEVMHQIYDRIKNGREYDEESWAKIEESYRREGCQKVLLACTELSVIKADEHLSAWFVDPMETLARVLIAHAGKTWK